MMSNCQKNLFVPGRLCLFGEHSDWAGAYRSRNPQLTPGYCITAGTEQGIGGVACRDRRLRITSSLPDGSTAEPLDIAMNPRELLELARAGEFWSYAAGVAYETVIRFPVTGLDLRLNSMDLPIKKGLSSSAALCVLLSSAWNRVYDLGMNRSEIMDLAFRGEIRTGSSCGRMDQICAYGRTVCHLTFDGDDMHVEPLQPGGTFFLLIVDLRGSKDTVRILRDLNSHFPAAPGTMSRKVRDALGPLNEQILVGARQALIDGNASVMGELMVLAQGTFDLYVAPASPEDLSSPRLHRLLSHAPLKELIYGGKGVGSQGDGTAQLLARGEEERNEAREIVQKDLDMVCYDLTLSDTSIIRTEAMP